MFDTSALITFIVAAYILIVIPGPAVLYVVARSIDQGRMAGIMSVLGVSVGAFVHTVAAALGISALLAASAVAFSVVKYAGAAYLVYLGVRTLLRRAPDHEEIVVTRKPLWQIFRQGVVVNVLNPKAALFFLAFLPQFADPARGSVPIQMLVLGLIFVVIALISDGIYALLAGQIGNWLQRNPRLQRRQRYFSGTVYIALGLTTAVSGADSSG